MPQHVKLVIRLYGPFDASLQDGSQIEIRSAKLQALLALLATASEGKRTRSWLQDMLWSRSGPEHGRASLRQALSALRAVFAEHFTGLFSVTNDAIRLNRDAIVILGDARDGEFLEGMDIAEDRFEDWLREHRIAPDTPPAVRQRSLRFEQILPSVAVVPFVVTAREPHDSPLGDAVAQEITRALSRSTMISVISHLSCRNLNPRSMRLADLRSALGVDYLAWGNLRLNGDRMQIDVDFIVAATGEVRWTLSFADSVSDFLQGQSGVTAQIASQIGQSILAVSTELATTRPLPEVESHALLMSGISMMHHQSLASFSRARTQIEEVVRRAPRHSIVHAWLAKWYILNVQQGWTVDLAADMAVAHGCTTRALQLNPECSFSLAIDGFVRNNLMKRPDEADSCFDEALSIDPNNALAWLLKGTLHAFLGEGETAVACTGRARALSPLDPYAYFFDSLSATASAAAGNYAQALQLAERSLRANRRHTSTLRVRTGALQLLGRHEEARASAADLMRAEPGFTIRRYLETHPAADFRIGRDWAQALEEAGVPRG